MSYEIPDDWYTECKRERWILDRDRVAAEIERLRNELKAACDALRNDFEPDNQSRAWHRANDALNL